MATTVAAMKGHLGDTDYYVISMKAQELINNIKIPKEMDDWDDLSVEELYQRDINYGRVKQQIAPYLASDPNRFFGAIIVAAMNHEDNLEFENLSDLVTKGMPKLYAASAQNMGFLTLHGGEILVPLDGQHRLKAIEFAITGRDEKGRNIEGITPSSALANEDVAVILVPYESKKARRIFTRVNRYAKPTTTGQNIVTDDDDFIAVLSREIVNDKIGTRVAKYTNNILTKSDGEFTTLAIIYNCNKEILQSVIGHKLVTTMLPDDAEQKLWRRTVTEKWDCLLSNISVFADAIDDSTEVGDANRRDIRKNNLLGRPVVQECVVKAFLRLTAQPTLMSDEQACNALNALPWDVTEDNLSLWQNILWTGGLDGRMITKNRQIATDIIAYLAKEKLTPDQLLTLEKNYVKLFPEGERTEKKLPVLDDGVKI